MVDNNPIFVTKTFLPPLEEYMAQVKRAFDNEWLTNRGELVRELEEKLKVHLEIDNVLITNNGTVPIQIALKLLANGGEVITTPFSYVATTAAIVWENCTPVFVDIDPEYLTIDETKIEAAITQRTTCILATHVFGNPCNIDAIDAIAKRHNLKVIYDAAHCFNVKYKGASIFSYGDVSTCSFHATKLFHTAEGGAVFCQDESLREKIYYSHNFGHNGPLAFHGLGINGKISELQAAMGLAVLPHMPEIIAARKSVIELYQQELNWKRIKRMHIRTGTTWNYSYFPILFESEAKLLIVQSALEKSNFIPRRYFYPSLNTLDFANPVKSAISEDVSQRILCLPVYVGLDEGSIKEISRIINSLA